MEPNLESNQGNDSSSSPALNNNAELQHKSIAEKQRFELLKSELELTKLIANQVVDKCRRECMNLKEYVSRLEEDRKILREREMKDQERINNLLKKVENNEKEFAEKLFELNMRNRDLECAFHTNTNMFEKDSSISEVEEKQLPSEMAVEAPKEKLKGLASLRKSNMRSNERCKTSESRRTLTTTNPSTHNETMYQGKGLNANFKRKRECTGRKSLSDQQLHSVDRAEKFQSNLKSGKPSFIKLMIPSNVYVGFILHLPKQFCKANLTTDADDELMMILEDEKGLEYKTKYIGTDNTSMFSAGWGRFAMAHNLELGDVLIFELSGPTRFKVYIIKANQQEGTDDLHEMNVEYTDDISLLGNTRSIENQDHDDIRS